MLKAIGVLLLLSVGAALMWAGYMLRGGSWHTPDRSAGIIIIIAVGVALFALGCWWASR